MLNEPGNPNIEAFDGAVPKLTIRSFDRLKSTTLALGFEFRWIAIERQLRPHKPTQPRSFDTGQISNVGDPGKASCLNLRCERIAAKNVRQQRGTET